MAFSPLKFTENLFYGITIISTFTCLIRPDWNFAFGLLCYYMIKTNDSYNSIRMLLIVNVGLIIFDIVWCLTLGSVWANKPAHDEAIWEGFNGIHNWTIFFSIINILVRAVALFFLFQMFRGAQ